MGYSLERTRSIVPQHTARRPTVWLVALAGLILAGGCDHVWQKYEAIELGKPLPPGLLPMPKDQEAKGRRVETTCSGDVGAVLLPPIIAHAATSVRLDKSGQVVSKAYYAMAFGQWFLCQSVAVRWVVEVQVPREAWHEAPHVLMAQRLEKVLLPLEDEAPLPPARDHLVRYQAQFHRTQTGWEYMRAFRLNESHLSRDIVDRLNRKENWIPVRPGTDVDLPGELARMDRGKSSVTFTVARLSDGQTVLEVQLFTPLDPTSNAPDFIGQSSAEFGGGGLLPSGEGYLLFRLTTIHFYHAAMLIASRSPFPYRAFEGDPSFWAGVTTAGFSGKKPGVFGDLSVQTLPGRRVRMEYRLFRLYDPFLLCALHELNRLDASSECVRADVPIHYVSRTRDGVLNQWRWVR